MRKMKVNCEDLELLIQDYLDGYILPAQARDVEEHLDECVSCRRELLRMKKLEEEFGEAVPLEVPPGFGLNVADILPPGPVPFWAGRVFRAGAAGIGAFVVLLLVVLVGRAPRSDGRREVEIVFRDAAAGRVHVSGDFNEWNLGSHPMIRGSDGTWRIRLDLSPGVYQYNFYLDNRRWADDLGNRALVGDGFGGRNAILFIEG
jgi:hypothetical protein